MAITRSPAYPGVSVNQAIDLVAKVYAENRTNPVDRDAAARDMGFAGMTGSSSKALADLAHYGLIEKAGKGAIRVTQRAVDILYPSSPAGRAEAFESGTCWGGSGTHSIRSRARPRASSLPLSMRWR